jgi:hypothetical protein
LCLHRFLSACAYDLSLHCSLGWIVTCSEHLAYLTAACTAPEVQVSTRFLEAASKYPLEEASSLSLGKAPPSHPPDEAPTTWNNCLQQGSWKRRQQRYGELAALLFAGRFSIFSTVVQMNLPPPMASSSDSCSSGSKSTYVQM